MEAETRIEHRTDDDIDEKLHLVDQKPQTDFESFVEQLSKTDVNPADVENNENPKPRPDIGPNASIKSQSEDKYTKVESHMDVKTPLEIKPNSESKHSSAVNPHSETKQHVDGKLHSENKQHVDGKLHSEIKQHVDGKPLAEIKQHVNDKSYSGVKQQAEVKTRFDVKENAAEINTQFKHQTEIKPYQSYNNKHQTEVKSHFDVTEHADGKQPHSDPTPLHPEVVKSHSDFKHQSETKTQVEVKPPQIDFKHQAEVKTHLNFKHQSEVKPPPHSDFKQYVEIDQQPAQYADVKSNVAVRPLKTKVDADFNLVASMLKISGCNIYGRMYRVGKIIAELSNPCLECMCTEIGVHCNQLKC